MRVLHCIRAKHWYSLVKINWGTAEKIAFDSVHIPSTMHFLREIPEPVFESVKEFKAEKRSFRDFLNTSCLPNFKFPARRELPKHSVSDIYSLILFTKRYHPWRPHNPTPATSHCSCHVEALLFIRAKWSTSLRSHQCGHFASLRENLGTHLPRA